MPRIASVSVLVVLVLFLASCNRFSPPSADEVRSAIRQEASSKTAPKYVTEGVKHSPRVWKMLQRFYSEREYKPLWTGDQHLSVQDVVSYLCRADEEGLNPGNYHLNAIRRGYESAYEKTELDRGKRAVRTAELELTVTYALMTYGSHLRNGYARPKWDVDRRDPAQVDDVLLKVSNPEQLKQTLASLLPRHAQYQELKQALRQYREIAERGGWAPLNRDSTTGELANRLLDTGDVQPPARGAAIGPRELLSGLKHFQRRHGLTETGKLDPATLAAMNVSVQDRVHQIEINLERWRWLPQDLGRRYILVNVPAFELNGFEDDKLAITMPVVVGKEFKPTPLFSDRMTYFVLNPSWNLPDSIVKEEVLPRLQTDPDYLTRNEIEVLPPEGNEAVDASSIEWMSVDSDNLEYRFRQKPGDENSLGRIKFMFPNQFDVYLHDTPNEQLFKRTKRDFSHGCVRVSRPVDLAEWILKDSPDWTREKLAEKITDNVEQTGEDLTEETIKIPRPLPVYILYWTAWVQDDKTVSFRDDLYDEDKRLLRAMPAQVAKSGEAKRVCQQIFE